MPNGGTDCCGECAFNPLSLRRMPDRLPGSPGRCVIRGITTTRPFYTYCANFHTGSLTPVGPVFAGFDEYGRLPWAGDRQVDYHRGEGRPCAVCGATPSRLALAGDDAPTHFCGPDHYRAWWQAAYPGENADYPWVLHDAMFDARRRATGRDTPRGVRERLLWWVRRR